MSRLIEKGLPLATLKNAIDRAEKMSSPYMHPFGAKIMAESLKEALEHALTELIEHYVEVETMIEAIEHARKEAQQ